MTPERYLIDTTIWIRFLWGGDEALRDKVSTLVLKNSACTSEIIIMEILRGAKSDKEFRMLYNDLLALPQLSINKEVWELAWKNSYKLRKKGLNIPMADIIIISTAEFYDCILLHSDTHFSLAEKHIKLKTERV